MNARTGAESTVEVRGVKKRGEHEFEVVRRYIYSATEERPEWKEAEKTHVRNGTTVVENGRRRVGVLARRTVRATVTQFPRERELVRDVLQIMVHKRAEHQLWDLFHHSCLQYYLPQ